MSVLCPSPLQPRCSLWCEFGCRVNGIALALTVRGSCSSRLSDRGFGAIRRRAGRRLAVDHVDNTVVTRFLSAHPVIAVDVVRDALDVLAHIGRHQLFEAGIESQDLARMNL